MISINKKIKILAIVGPTACGKTDFGVKLAKKINGEIVSADSMQIYKKLCVGTAKPTLKEMDGIKHHLVDFLEPTQEYSVAQYVKQATAAILEIKSKNKIPILVGGTGLYINSLLDGINFIIEEKDGKLRKKLIEQIENEGGENLLKKLSKFDPETANKLHPNDKLRIIRALEIFELTGIPMSEHIKNSKQNQSLFQPLIFGLTFKNRENLYARINNRAASMLQSGLIEEALMVKNSNFSKTAKNAICYKELFDFLENKETLDEATEKLKQKTRRYAKRQLTWFRKDSRIKWLIMDDGQNSDNIFNNCINDVENFKRSCYNFQKEF